MPIRCALLLVILANTVFAQAALSLGSATGAPGARVFLNLTFNSGTAVVAGLQWTVNYSQADVAAIQVVIGPASTSTGHLLYCSSRVGAVECVLVNPKGKNVASGVIGVVTIDISRSTRDGASAVGLSNVLGASPGGSVLPIQAHGAVLPITGSALRFRPVTPCRIADTRKENAADGPSISGNTHRDFDVPDAACGIPSTAAAYSLNVSVYPAGPLGYVTVWATGQVQPLVATMNSLDGRIKSNAVIVAAGTHGSVSAYVTDPTDLTVDIDGYFVPATDAAALAFYPLKPCRISDTRKPAGVLGGPGLSPGHSRILPVRQSACAIPADAQAYSLNLSVVPPGPLAALTAWAAGQPQPAEATMSAPTGIITANAFIVAAGSNGDVAVVASDETDLVIDINGYFAAEKPGGLSLYNVAPCRVLDTRLAGAAPFKGARDVDVAGSGCAALATAQAYIFNATVVPPGPLGYITLWPQGATQPVVATLNATDGTITSNIAIVPTTNGSVSVFASDPTDVVLDLFGFFAP